MKVKKVGDAGTPEKPGELTIDTAPSNEWYHEDLDSNTDDNTSESCGKIPLSREK